MLRHGEEALGPAATRVRENGRHADAAVHCVDHFGHGRNVTRAHVVGSSGVHFGPQHVADLSLGRQANLGDLEDPGGFVVRGAGAHALVAHRV